MTLPPSFEDDDFGEERRLRALPVAGLGFSIWVMCILCHAEVLAACIVPECCSQSRKTAGRLCALIIIPVRLKDE